MTLQEKLAILSAAAKYDASCASSGASRGGGGACGVGSTAASGICHSFTPDGRCISLLKILFTNFCVFDCAYCINRLSSEVPRAKFSPDEVIQLTMEFYRRNYIEGLFLSSGVFRSPDHTFEEMIEVARSLRQDHAFRGYIHLKAVAGCSSDLLAKAGLYADRLSANIELPTQQELDMLAPAKRTSQIEDAMKCMHEHIDDSSRERRSSSKAPVYASAGQTTQMIVGATPADDATILGTADQLYRKHNLRRVYYSAFSPINSSDARLPAQSPPLQRENRLYQADWMLRYYGFEYNELFSTGRGNLRLDMNPKLSWALRNQHMFPVDVNRAAREMLLRVPGLGPRNVDRIIELRKHTAVRYSDLGKLGVGTKQAKYFVITSDYNSNVSLLQSRELSAAFAPPAQQLDLFATVASL